MPQDTVSIETTHGQYNIVPSNSDSLNQAIQNLKTVLTKEQEFKRKSDEYSSWAPLYTFILLAAIWIIIRIKHGRNNGYVEIGSSAESSDDEVQEETRDHIRLEGYEIRFSREEMKEIIEKRFPYFDTLSQPNREKFILRLQKFIRQKTFKIHDESGYKEMPVLISAAAIQLSFGLEKYQLPDFPFINIFPREFIGTHPSIRFLEGNVSGNSINISWKHFLNGFESPDGQNLGLHEMAHAYYCQNFETSNHTDNSFVSAFSNFNSHGNSAFELEQKTGNDLYSAYAMKNFQEFWAESVEIFFERPLKMRTAYPDLYVAMSDLLNQDPANKI